MTTFVLIHGAYQGGWIWQSVAARLQGAGHRVYAPSLDGCGERAAQLRPGITTESQAEEIAGLLYYEDLQDIVLAATSAGGMVAARVAETMRDRIDRLVFIDALALKHGEKIRDIVTRPSPINTELATGRSRQETYEKLLLELDPEMAGWAADRFGLHPIATFMQPVVLDSFWDQSWNASVVFCRNSENPGEAHQRRCAEALDARWHALDTGHYPMLSAPDALSRLIAGD